jgi:hypothetical protein
LAFASLTGCAVKQQQQAQGDPESGLLLTYHMPDDRSLRYRTTVEQTHSMQTMGQSRQFGADKSLEVSVKSRGSSEDGHDLTITVDSLHIRLDTPRGEIEREIAEVLGKSFGMVLSPSGEESGFTGANEVSYDMPPAGRLNVATDFQAFFPNLADGPLLVGESWPTEEQITDTAFNSGKMINLQSVHTLAGFETIDGMKCARINSRMNGMLEQTGERMTRAPEMTARFEGNAVWFFAYEKGLLASMTMTLRGAGEMTTRELHGLPSQMSQEMTIETRLLP